MGSQGILKTTDGGDDLDGFGRECFRPGLHRAGRPIPAIQCGRQSSGRSEQQQQVVAGTKKGLYFSYDGGVNWSGPCLTNALTSQRQDITGLELSNMGGGVTRVLAAVGTRGFATTVQHDLGLQGANGLYKGTMPASGCPI